MSIAEGGKKLISGPPTTKEEAYARCFSEEARQQQRERYSPLPPSEVEAAIDRVVPIFERATVPHFIPILVERSIKEIAREQGIPVHSDIL